MTTALEGGEWSAACSGCTLPLGKTRYPLYRRLGEPQGQSGWAENLAPPGFDTRTFQPVVSRYTDWATWSTNSASTFPKTVRPFNYYNVQNPKDASNLNSCQNTWILMQGVPWFCLKHCWIPRMSWETQYHPWCGSLADCHDGNQRSSCYSTQHLAGASWWTGNAWSHGGLKLSWLWICPPLVCWWLPGSVSPRARMYVCCLHDSLQGISGSAHHCASCETAHETTCYSSGHLLRQVGIACIVPTHNISRN